MKDRPIIKLNLSFGDKIIEFIAWLSLAIVWIMTISNFNQLPEIIPTHFNASGQANGFGW
ncbi:MAG: DUF1648 domain-containing protein [Bacteroidia bacterium]|nr:DUF1648 domain-containing protein [Bacteroidia bacterium]MCF8428114.1 DUF1648 domain-containing protein [Bacteroidia bacterium]